ncbi:MAG: hypothetical protein ACW967_09080 [Candidatus Hodarchaeales archaeon]
MQNLANDLSIIFSLIGALLFLYSIYLSWIIIKMFPESSRTLKYWYLAILLQAGFLFGYLINILVVLSGDTELQLLLTSFVYLGGAVFVLVVVWVSYKTYKIILQ